MCYLHLFFWNRFTLRYIYTLYMSGWWGLRVRVGAAPMTTTSHESGITVISCIIFHTTIPLTWLFQSGTLLSGESPIALPSGVGDTTHQAAALPTDQGAVGVLLLFVS